MNTPRPYLRRVLAAAVFGLGVLVLPAARAEALPPALSNVVIITDGTSPSKSMELRWDATTHTPFANYEILSGSGSGVIDWYDYDTNKAATSYSLPGWGNKNSPGAFVLGNTYSVGMDIAESPGVWGPRTMADVKLVANPVVTVAGSTASSISISWTAAAASDPFVSYDIFLAPTSYGGSLSDCWSAWEAGRTNNAKTITTVPSGCGGGSIAADTAYRVGVRTIQKSGNPSIWTQIGEATMTTSPALPAQCNSTDEAFCTVYPDAFVKNASWPSGEQGDAVVMNGVNTKHAPRLNTAGTSWDTQNVIDIIDELDASGPSAFNAIRISMDWGMFQYENGSNQVVLDNAAFDELDDVIDEAIDKGIYVILVPVHIRKPGNTLCTSSGNRLYEAHYNVPRWAWDEVDLSLSTANCNSYTSTYDDLVDNALALTEAQDYLREVSDRYSDFSTTPKGDRSRQVVAIDLVNEMTADGANVAAENDTVLNFYDTTIDGIRANTDATDKIFIAEAAHGDTSLAKNATDLADLASTSNNIVLSFHDYFGGAAGGGTLSGHDTGPTGYGLGYSSYGFVSGSYQERTDGIARPYTHANEAAQHRTYVEQMAGWAADAELPIYIGEYGIYNPCWGNNAGEADDYAADTKALYDSVAMDVDGASVDVAISRTWWVHGYATDNNAMELQRSASGCGSQSQGTYFSYAFDL